MKIPDSWSTKLQAETSKPYFESLSRYISKEREVFSVFPPENEVFQALKLCGPDQVRVVILGQDPYHAKGQAHGLSFSVPPGVKIPPSLRNIYKELDRDFPEFTIPLHGNLISWAKQGVLLLNTSLTVREASAGSHAKIGWEEFTDTIIQTVSQKSNQPVVFMLWGTHAQNKKPLILENSTKHLILESAHPSPLSAHRGFIGCGHFSSCNSFLEANQVKPINWLSICQNESLPNDTQTNLFG